MACRRLRVVSQNTAKRVRTADVLTRHICGHDPDVIALQEITLAQLSRWRELLEAHGYRHCITAQNHGRTGGALLASRLPIAFRDLHTDASLAPRIAAGTIDGFNLASVYFPVGRYSPRWSDFYADITRKIEIHEFILVGDFQMVVQETEISSGTFRRWKRDISFLTMQQMLQHWRDAFRSIHGPGKIAFSHQHISGARWLIDHAFVPPTLEILGCEIDWQPIEAGLSDHAALIVDLAKR